MSIEELVSECNLLMEETDITLQEDSNILSGFEELEISRIYDSPPDLDTNLDEESFSEILEPQVESLQIEEKPAQCEVLKEVPKMMLCYERAVPQRVMRYSNNSFRSHVSEDLYDRLYNDFYERQDRRRLLRKNFYDDLRRQNTIKINDLSRQLADEADSLIIAQIIKDRDEMLRQNLHLLHKASL